MCDIVVEVDIIQPADWVWVCTQELNLEEFRMVVFGCWWLWFNRESVEAWMKGIKLLGRVLKIRSYLYGCDMWMRGRNRMLQGLWGICQRKAGQRKLYCDASFDNNDNTMGFALLRTVKLCNFSDLCRLEDFMF
ncbi:hypothetical protein QQ045_031252 [Rhodiola kirilowii]